MFDTKSMVSTLPKKCAKQIIRTLNQFAISIIRYMFLTME